MMNKTISRREFLKGSLAATGLTIIASVTPFGTRLVNASDMKEGAAEGLNPSAYFQITPDNVVKVMVPNSEMGQGVRTALPMIIADELEADWNQLEIIQAPAADAFKNPILQNQLTVASASVRGFYWPMRKAGAAGRAMLIEAAANEWKVPKSECEAVKGTVVHRKSSRSLTYGQLCLKAAKLQVPQEPTLKKESEFRYMGKAMPRVDIPEKVSGKAVFGFDVKLPDMHYAVLARPPAYGAKHLSFDQNAAMQVKGVKKVVPTPRGIAVVAESVDAAWKGRDALNVKWDKGTHPDMDTESIEKQFMADLDKPGANVVTIGDVHKALGEAKKTHEATYYIPYVAHATMEPQTCTADFRPDRCDVYIPTQGQTLSHQVATKVSGLSPDKVHIHTTLLGCGLGRRPRPDQLIESIIASKALGKPVKVVYTREEDIKTDFFRSAMAHRIKAGLDDQDRLIAWDHKVSSSSLTRMNAGHEPEGGIDWYCLWGLWDAPKSPNKARITYQFPNFSVNLVLSDLPIPVAPWRSVQNAVNAFANESFMDEMAHLAGKDPISFRLDILKDDKRAYRVLENLAINSNWGKPLPKGWGRGVAQHRSFGTTIAEVAEVSVDEKTGALKVHRVDVSVDCGPVVNPDPLKAQIEGAVTMGVSTVLKEIVTFKDGGVESSNFDDYGLIRMSEVPDIHIHVIESNDDIGGIGEPGVMPLAPAVANAVYNATGARIRRIPLTPQTILSALKKA
jgi:isoquinoline 1-oxidoreductase beta subunit